MLYSEMVAAFAHRLTQHVNKLCEQNVECSHVEPGGIYSNHWALHC